MQASQTAKNAVELLPAIFKRKLNGSQLMFALGECIAHVNYLIAAGDIERTLKEGCYYYQATREAPADEDTDMEPQLIQPV